MGKRRGQGEGTVYFNEARGRWEGQVWVDDRRRKVTAKTKREVTVKIGRLIHGDEGERLADRSLTVSSLLVDWSTKAVPNKALAPSTREAHRWAAGLLTEHLGKVKVANLDAPMVEAALTRMMTGRSLSKASLIKVRSTLRQALAWAERRRLVAHNAAAAAELPGGATGTRSRRALTVDELARLTEALEGHPWAAMFGLMARAGLRPGEAGAVCVDALDLDGTPPTVAVVRGVQLHRGRPTLVDDLKTAGARRVLAVPADLRDDLARHLAVTGITEGLLFPAPNGSPAWASSVRTELAEACDMAGIDSAAPNELRHTAATHLADSGLSPHQVADILGHRSTRMVDAVYRHRPAVILGADAAVPRR